MTTIAATYVSLLATDNANTVTQRLTNSAGKMFAHTPFGQRSPAAEDETGPGFNGQYLEPSGAYLLGNGYRAYSPTLRRFNSPDSYSPFGAGGLNSYAYCQGEPVNHRDPSGHADGDLLGGFIVGGGIMMALLGFGMAFARPGRVAAFATLSGAGAGAAMLGGVGLATSDQGLKAGLSAAAVGLTIGGAFAAGGMMRGAKGGTGGGAPALSPVAERSAIPSQGTVARSASISSAPINSLPHTPVSVRRVSTPNALMNPTTSGGPPIAGPANGNIGGSPPVTTVDSGPARKLSISSNEGAPVVPGIPVSQQTPPLKNRGRWVPPVPSGTNSQVTYGLKWTDSFKRSRGIYTIRRS